MATIDQNIPDPVNMAPPFAIFNNVFPVISNFIIYIYIYNIIYGNN